uniref:Ankyrin repeat and death domain containing 1A n=1 Tax=Oncorhynchus mykiss TaxID=8022 RepID=A0A8C7QTS2_ONCMY
MEDDLVSEDDILLRSEKEFHDAAKRNDTDKMRELMKKGVDIKAKNKVSRTALHWAAGAGNEQALRLLLDHNNEVDVEDSFGMNPLLLAAWFGHLKILQILVASGAKLNCENKNGLGLLHCAAQRGHSRVLEFIMEDLVEDVLLDRVDNSGKTAFHLAAEHGQLEVVEFLIGMGCTHGLKDKDEHMAIHLAAKHGHNEVLQKLVETGVDIDERNIDGLTPLHLSSDGGHYECVKLLLEACCNVNALTNKNMNALHYVAQHGFERETSLLLEAGVNTDTVDGQHTSPLHTAVLHNHTEVVRLLIDAECDLDISDNVSNVSTLWALQSSRFRNECFGISELNISLLRSSTAMQSISNTPPLFVYQDNVISDDDSWLGKQLSFKQDHQVETQHLRSVTWRLATKDLSRGEWKSLAQHWGFTDAHIRSIEQQWTGTKSFKEHGHRMLLIWLHGVVIAGENPIKGLYEGLTGISRTDLAESIRQKANADTSSPKKCTAM